MKNKSFACLDMKSLYTIISVNECIKLLENHLKKFNATLLLPMKKIIKICTLSTKHCFFWYKIYFS